MERIRILIVDDHPLIHEGMKLMLNLEPKFQVLGSASDGVKGLKLVRQWQPDVVVLDLNLPEMPGLDAIRFYLEVRPDLRIVVFTGLEEESVVYQALRAGARAFVTKGSTAEELKQAIHYVWQGGYWLSPRFSPTLIAAFLKDQPLKKPEIAAFEALSEREQQVFRLMVDGKETEEIGEILAISVSTVAKHRSSLMKALNLKNAVEMTRFAIRNHLIEA